MFLKRKLKFYKKFCYFFGILFKYIWIVELRIYLVVFSVIFLACFGMLYTFLNFGNEISIFIEVGFRVRE